MLYFLRAIAALLITSGFCLVCLYYDCNREIQHRGIKYVLGMDLIHDLFTGLIPFLLVALIYPALKKSKSRIWADIFTSGMIGFIAGAFPYIYLNKTQADFAIPTSLVVAFVLIGINSFLFVFFREDEISVGFKKTLRSKKAAVVSDLILPLAVWASYRSKNGRLFYFARLIPLIHCVAPIMLLGLIAIPQKDYYGVKSPHIHALREYESYFNLKIDEQEKRLWASKGNSLLVYSWEQDTYKAVGGPFLGDGINTAALHPERNTCLAFHAADNRIRLSRFNTKTLEQTEETEFSIDLALTPGSSITLWDPKREILIAVFESGIFRFSPDGKMIRARLDGIVDANSALLDPKRRLVYICMSYMGAVIALDADTLEIRNQIPVPELAKRLAIDSARDRLFVSFPKEGLIRVIDLDRFEIIKSIPSIFGVRSLFVDKEQDILLAGGFAPYLEAFRLSDYCFEGRMKSPPWLRTIAMDRKNARAWFSTNYGLWEWDTKALSKNQMSKWIDRLDPFFLVQRIAFRVLAIAKRPSFANTEVFKTRRVEIEGIDLP